jgi:Cu2+-containing amine oxidase
MNKLEDIENAEKSHHSIMMEQFSETKEKIQENPNQIELSKRELIDQIKQSE